MIFYRRVGRRRSVRSDERGRLVRKLIDSKRESYVARIGSVAGIDRRPCRVPGRLDNYFVYACVYCAVGQRSRTVFGYGNPRVELIAGADINGHYIFIVDIISDNEFLNKLF